MSAGLLGSLPAQATPLPSPSTPGTSGDAKTAWQHSSHLAEIASEQVNGAKQAQLQAAQTVKRADSNLVGAKKYVTTTKQAVAAASATVSSYETKLDAFASASFKGARLSQLSVMLSARSADDFLDESTVIDRVAQDTQKTLDDAVAAKNTAATAKSDADSAEASAAQAKTKADLAATAAAAATVTAQNKKADLDAAVAQYQDLYNKLSAQEKAAAAAAAEKARQESLAAAAAAQAQAEADAAAAKQAAASSSSSSSAEGVTSNSPADQTSDSSSSDLPPSSTTSSSTASTSPATSATASSSASTEAEAAIQGGDSAGQTAAAAAMTKIGFAYVYAGDGPDAYDCSGLTTWAWAQAGVSIPRVSYEQANFPEVPLDQLQPGDLVTYYSPVSHVAIYVGNGMVVSAADEELGIVYVPVSKAGPDATGHRVPRG